MLFEWDDDKNKYNKAVHKIDFETAALVFADEHRIVLYDEKHSEYEDRYKTIGSINGFVTVITVIYSVRSKSIRIISARKADRKEKEQYYGKKRN